MKEIVIAGLCLLVATSACGSASLDPRASSSSPTSSHSAIPSSNLSPSPQQDSKESDKYVGFYPDSRVEDGKVVMPLTFLDRSRAEVVAPQELGIQDMLAAIYTAGGLGGVDRTMDFRYREPAGFTFEGPLETYGGHGGNPVEVWRGTPGDWECPNLVFRFGDWFVGVRTCQPGLSESEKQQWAELLAGEVTAEGFLVLSATEPLKLQVTGGHEGPEMYLGMERDNWIQLTPGECDPQTYASHGDIKITSDGTRVSFSRVQNPNSKADWFVSWCEDGLMRIQVEYAYEEFAKAAAENLRVRNIVLAR